MPEKAGFKVIPVDLGQKRVDFSAEVCYSEAVADRTVYKDICCTSRLRVAAEAGHPERYKNINIFCVKLLQNDLKSDNYMIFDVLSCALRTITKNKDGRRMAKKELIRLICEILKEMPKERVYTVFIFTKGLYRG